MPGTMFIQAASLAALPTSGSAWTALTAKSTTDPGSGNLGALDQNHPLAVFSIALRWARDGGGLGKQYVIDEIKSVMGTESSAGQPLNPYRTLGAYVMAADLVDMPGNTVGANGQTFDAWMQSWPNKVIPGQANWNTLEKCSRTSGNNWGACARTSLLAVLLWLRKRGLQPAGHDRETLITQCNNWYKRFVGDTSVPNTFTATGAYQSNWAVSTYPGSQGVINPVSMTVRSGVTLDGANVEDASRSTFPDKGGAGKHYQFESLDSAMVYITLAINAGYTDAAGWGNNGVRRNYRYFITNGITAPDSDFHHFMWMQPTMANYLFSGLGFPVPSGFLGDRVQRRMLTTHTDWLTSSGSTWLKVGGSTGGGGSEEPPPPVVQNPTVTDISFTVNNQSVLVSAVVQVGTAPISTYRFIWGDGTTTGPQSSPSASHAYDVAVPRTFAVRVEVVATDGGTASRSENSPTIFAPDAAPIARVTLDKTTLIGGGTVAYDMSASEDANGDPITYTADSGEGETKTTVTGTFTYADVTERTDYTATFTATAGGVTSTPVVRTITVIPQATANAVGVPYLVFNGQKVPLVPSHGSAWNGNPLTIGAYRLWVDATGDLRIKNGPPTSDTDGTVVGTQS